MKKVHRYIHPNERLGEETEYYYLFEEKDIENLIIIINNLDSAIMNLTVMASNRCSYSDSFDIINGSLQEARYALAELKQQMNEDVEF